MALLSAGDRLAVLQLAGPSSGVVRCYIKRISGLLGMGQHFELRLESTDECLAIARRRVKSATSSFVIGLSASTCSSGSSTPSSNPSQHGGSNSSALHRDHPEVIGKVGPALHAGFLRQGFHVPLAASIGSNAARPCPVGLLVGIGTVECMQPN
jgi:hypothetical protein